MIKLNTFVEMRHAGLPRLSALSVQVLLVDRASDNVYPPSQLSLPINLYKLNPGPSVRLYVQQ